ncbi:MAG: hypothetical protein HXK67_02195 [Clostridiales bacterium]|jgi:probable serine/threonine-protein kinase roco9|nr:hypothetical protein [Clostridiales bacterium]
MNKTISKIISLIVILGIILAQTTVFANNVGQDPNNYITMPMSIKTNKAETITINNIQNYRLAYQLVETPTENYKKYVAFIDESNAKKAQLVNEKNQLKAVVEAAQAEAEAKYKVYSALNSNISASNEQREQAKAAFEAAKRESDKAMQPYQAKLNEMDAYDRLTDETLKSCIPLYDDSKWVESNGTFIIPSNNDGRERIVTVWVKLLDENSNAYYEATMYPFNLGKAPAEVKPKKYTLELQQGRQYDLIMENHNPNDFTWNVENPDIAEITNGKIIGKNPGTTTLNGISNDGRTKVLVEVTVTEVRQPEPNNNQNPTENTNNQNNNSNTTQPTNNTVENTNNQNNNSNTTEQTNELQNNPKIDNNTNNNQNSEETTNKPTENTNNQNNNSKPTETTNKPVENINNQNNNSNITETTNKPKTDNTSNTNTEPTVPNAVNNNTEVPKNTNSLIDNSSNRTSNQNNTTRSSNINNSAQAQNTTKQNAKAINSGSINAGLEKDQPKRLPQTGDIPMGAVITIGAACAIAIVMLAKMIKLKNR